MGASTEIHECACFVCEKLGFKSLEEADQFGYWVLSGYHPEASDDSGFGWFIGMLTRSELVADDEYKPRLPTWVPDCGTGWVAVLADGVTRVAATPKTKHQAERLKEMGCACSDLIKQELSKIPSTDRKTLHLEDGYYPSQFYCYYLAQPIDFGWECLVDVADILEQQNKDFLKSYEAALWCLYTTGFWCTELRHASVISAPNSDGLIGVTGFLLKESNNGDSYLLSSEPLSLDSDTVILSSPEAPIPSLSRNSSLAPSPPVYSATKVSDFIEWNGLYCRSQPEESIAKELERRGLNFMVNPGGRFTTNEGRKTREPDFLVFLGDGKSAILEVDGEAFHQSAAKDHDRDRVFRRLGVPVERFTAKQCTNDPSAVVSEFLALVSS